jgi:hypothetical protein
MTKGAPRAERMMIRAASMIQFFMQNSSTIMATDGSEKMIILGFVARFDLPREVFGSQDAEGSAHGKKWHHA